MSKQIGQVNSLWRLRADTAISVSSVMASCGVRWSSYKERSHDRSTGSLAVIILKFLLWFHEFPEIFHKILIFLFQTFLVAFFPVGVWFQQWFSLETYLNLNGRSPGSLVVIIETKILESLLWFHKFSEIFHTELCFLDPVLDLTWIQFVFLFLCAALSVTLSLLELLSGCKQK